MGGPQIDPPGPPEHFEGPLPLARSRRLASFY